MRRLFKIASIFCMLSVALTSCEGLLGQLQDDYDFTVKVRPGTDITESSVVVSGYVKVNDGEVPDIDLKVGVLIDFDTQYQNATDVKVDYDKEGNFSVEIPCLEPNTVYWFKAYALYDGEYYYSDSYNFRTLKAGSGGGDTPVASSHIDSKIKVEIYDNTIKSTYFKGVFAGDAPKDYESTTPVRGFMYSSQYKTPEDIYEYGKWVDVFKYQTTGDASDVHRSYASDLQAGTTYYLIACAEYRNDVAWTCSEVLEFNTGVGKTDFNGHEYVDLGLSVKWAKCNVGSRSEKDLGTYFCWAETSANSYYGLRTYKYYAGTSSNGWRLFNKYVSYSPNAYDGKVDNIVAVQLEDDAARANMGGSWRLPHDSELQELIDKCTWEREYEEKEDGSSTCTNVKITGPNGNTLILPFSGNMADGSVLFANQGHYMGAELFKLDNQNCCELYFAVGNKTQDLKQNSRFGGMQVRAVTD